jgi:hypothetical protein
VAVLLAAGAVLKLTVGAVVNFFGMKPNFIIAMYCLAIMLIRPLALYGACSGGYNRHPCRCHMPVPPGTPWLNLISEPLGAIVMALLIRLPMKIGKVNLTAAFRRSWRR